MNLKLLIVENDEGPALGGAILAAVGCGKYKDVQEAKEKIIRYKEEILPDAELVAAYEERYSEYKKLVAAVLPLY